MVIKIELPFPDMRLSPNSRLHWSKKSKVARRYKNDCYFLTLQKVKNVNEKLTLTAVDFIPPDGRYRDDDNIIASFKSGRDGIARALNLDDRHFKPKYDVKTPVKGGAAIITLGVRDDC